MRVDDRLHLDRINAEARTDDQIARSAHDEQRTILIDASDVARIEPAIGAQCFRRLFGCAIVATHDTGASHPQLSGAALGHWFATRPHHAQLRAFHDLPGRAVAARPVRARDEQRACVLGHAITVMQRLTEHRLDVALEREIERATAGIEITQTLRMQRGNAGLAQVSQDATEHRRHTLQDRDIVALQRRAGIGHVEACNQIQAATGLERGEQQRRQPEDVRHRHDRERAVFRPHPADLRRHAGVVQQPAMRNHHALGLAGSA